MRVKVDRRFVYRNLIKITMSASASAQNGNEEVVAGKAPAESPKQRSQMHRAVERASFHIWNNDYGKAQAILDQYKTTHPRFALEHAFLIAVKGLMSASNEQREKMLDDFQAADNLAKKAKYTPQVVDLPTEDAEIDAYAEANATPSQTLSAAEKKAREAAAEKQREKDKAAFQKEKDKAAKEGRTLDQSWKLECDVTYADALFVRSIVQLTMNNYLKGGWNLKATWSCYLALLQELEKDTDHKIPRELEMNIKFGCGTFFCYLALVPGNIMSLLSAIGFISDRERGEAFLTEVAYSKTVRSPFAGLCLLTYYLFLPTGLGDVTETLAKAKAVLDIMNDAHPNNSYFTGYLNFYHRKRGETTEAVAAIKKATSNAERIGGVPLLLKYILADTLYMDLQFDEARAAYHVVLDTLQETGETFAYTGQVVISLAACYMWLGNNAEALKWLSRVSHMYNPKSKQDANSKPFADRVSKDPKLLPLIGVYVLYINRDLAHMHAGHVEKLFGEINRVVVPQLDFNLPEPTAMYQLFIGVIHKSCKRSTECWNAWNEALYLEKKLKSDSMVLPYLYYEMGETEYRAGKLDKAKEYFDKGSNMKGDGHETLANRYSIAKKQLQKAMDKAKAEAAKK